MFLDRLNDKEKEMFLDLAVYAAQANGVVDDTEKSMIMQYCKEMSVAFYDVSKLHSLDEIVTVFSKSSKEKKKIIILELLGLCYADNEFDDIEDAFVKKVSNDIGLKDDVYDTLKKDINEYSIILGILSGHILG